MIWLAIINASIGLGLALFDIRIAAVYAGLNFVAVVAAGIAAGSRSGAAWFILAGGKPTESLTVMEKRLVVVGVAGIASVVAVLFAAPRILS